MPIYEYRCPEGHSVERKESVAWAKCPTCGKRAKRVYSAPAIHFKGSGFYNTDYKGKKHHGAKDTGSKEGKSAQEVKSDADSSKGAGD